MFFLEIFLLMQRRKGSAYAQTARQGVDKIEHADMFMHMLRSA